MGATKRLYEEIIGKYENLEANFRMLEEEYFMECSRCNEKMHRDFLHYAGYPDHALCDVCNDDMNG